MEINIYLCDCHSKSSTNLHQFSTIFSPKISPKKMEEKKKKNCLSKTNPLYLRFLQLRKFQALKQTVEGNARFNSSQPSSKIGKST